MTEREIVDYLKQNWKKGIAFGFMPSEVQKWCEDNLLKTDIPFRKLSSPLRENTKPTGWFKLDDNNHLLSWGKLNYDEPFCYECVYALPEGYESKPEFKPHWEEFEIDGDGSFVEKTSNEFKRSYYWWNWAEFLNHNYEKYNAFGGWMSDDNDESWNLLPRLVDDEQAVYIMCNTYWSHQTVSPVIPVKIRFWRYKE